MLRALRWIVLGLGLLGILPVLLVVAFALAKGLDLASFWRALRYERPTFTIDLESLERAPYDDAVYVGRIERLEVLEASGLAASRRRDELFWALNDSGNPARLYALDARGADLGTLHLPVENIDWEDLAAFEHAGRPYLVVADVGDNFSWRPSVEIHVIEEPVVPAGGLPEDSEAAIAWSFRFRYEDGPRDCEAVAVDPEGPSLLVLGKREVPVTLYRVDLLEDEAPAGSVRVATKVTEVPNIPQPTEYDRLEDPDYGEYRSMPTAMDIDPEGRRALVMTYDHGYEFRRAPGESWAEAFAGVPTRFPVPTMRTSETVAFDRSGRHFYVTSEYRPTPLFRFDAR